MEMFETLLINGLRVKTVSDLLPLIPPSSAIFAGLSIAALTDSCYDTISFDTIIYTASPLDRPAIRFSSDQGTVIDSPFFLNHFSHTPIQSLMPLFT